MEYAALAQIYDQIMAGVDYDDWAEYISTLIDRHGGVAAKTALDLACGTGSTALALARRGFDVTGLDLSSAMIAVARSKAQKEGLRGGFMQADMREFTLSAAVGLVTAFQDGLNYLLSEEDIRRTFFSVHRALSPGGLFIFDINRIEKLPQPGSDVACVESEEFTLIFSTTFEQDNIWEIAVTGFVPTAGGLFERFREVHRERAISASEVRAALTMARFIILGEYAAFSLDPPGEAARRIFYVAVKEG